jgi:hypothetical protein
MAATEAQLGSHSYVPFLNNFIYVTAGWVASTSWGCMWPPDVVSFVEGFVLPVRSLHIRVARLAMHRPRILLLLFSCATRAVRSVYGRGVERERAPRRVC